MVGDDPIGVLIIRHPSEIALSIQSGYGISQPEALLMWNDQMRSAVRDLRGMPVMVTTYDEVMDDRLRWCETAATWLGRFAVNVPEGGIERAVAQLDPKQRGNVAKPEAPPGCHGTTSPYTCGSCSFVAPTTTGNLRSCDVSEPVPQMVGPTSSRNTLDRRSGGTVPSAVPPAST